ncbi:urease accessory protein UreD [uncultured Sulfitobacter sp.]|uniref:urease accessory protein UreD n=1 Tax=uncultured Sulfitobacter sp. TaxID=191468 RepID=UPI00263462A4|nr:urease accessory protein UreD [uncultured Sulfitobacter sp.]
MTFESPAIQQLTPSQPAVSSGQPRARGAVDLDVRQSHGATRIANLRQSGCLKCVFPRVFRPQAEAVLVNTSGGITGGDLLCVRARLAPQTALTVTTQAAERIYRTSDGTTGRIDTRITVERNAQLFWLPQETILFDEARLERRLDIALAAGATLLLVETLVLGRAAMGEQVRALHLEDRIRISRDGAPLYLDGVRLSGDATAQMARAATGEGAGVVSTLVYAALDAATQLAHIRAMLPDSAGASLRAGDLLVLRALAPDSLAMRRFLIPVLDRLSGNLLPTVWRL